MSFQEKVSEMEKEIDKMSIEELLYIRMAPQSYLMKKFEKEIQGSNNLVREIEQNSNDIKRNEEVINNQKAKILNECNKLKMEIEQSKNRINNLMLEKSKINRVPTKNEFVNSLDNDIKKSFKTPDNYFREFLSKKITQNEFLEKIKQCGTGKNYYYYKILSDKLKEM